MHVEPDRVDLGALRRAIDRARSMSPRKCVLASHDEVELAPASEAARRRLEGTPGVAGVIIMDGAGLRVLVRKGGPGREALERVAEGLLDLPPTNR